MKDLSVFFGTAGVNGMADDGSGETMTEEKKKKGLKGTHSTN